MCTIELTDRFGHARHIHTSQATFRQRRPAAPARVVRATSQPSSGFLFSVPDESLHFIIIITGINEYRRGMERPPYGLACGQRSSCRRRRMSQVRLTTVYGHCHRHEFRSSGRGYLPLISARRTACRLSFRQLRQALCPSHPAEYQGIPRRCLSHMGGYCGACECERAHWGQAFPLAWVVDLGTKSEGDWILGLI